MVVQKYLSFIVGMFLTLLTIGMGIAFWNITKPVYDSAAEYSRDQTRMVEESQYTPYDNHLLSGSDVLNALRRFEGKENFYIYVQKVSPTRNFGAVPGAYGITCINFNFTTGTLASGTMSCTTTESQMNDVTHLNYIAPQSRFRATVVRDANRRVAGIFFRMQ